MIGFAFDEGLRIIMWMCVLTAKILVRLFQGAQEVNKAKEDFNE